MHKILLNELKLEKLGILETTINAIEISFIAWKSKNSVNNKSLIVYVDHVSLGFLFMLVSRIHKFTDLIMHN